MDDFMRSIPIDCSVNGALQSMNCIDGKSDHKSLRVFN